jgi:4-hydroxybutyryl-CoA dehydratase/vinylacetyl-CoA-Delta-isomerase
MIDDPANHPAIKPAVNTLAKTFDMARDPDPEMHDLWVRKSKLIDEDVNAWLNIDASAEDHYKRARILRKVIPYCGCILKCMSSASILPVWALTWELDQEYNTEYHQRFREWLKNVQKNDLVVLGAITDVKGDRSLQPHQQDPDLHVHVHKRRKDGVVLRGAKVSVTGDNVANEIIVMPSRSLTEADKDCAICCAVPVDSPGLIMIVRPAPSTPRRTDMESFISHNQGITEPLEIFEDVFVPWERVFMDGEWEDCNRLAATINPRIERAGVCGAGCTAGRLDLAVGAAALMIEYNGLEKAHHLQDKLTQLAFLAEESFLIGVGAAFTGELHPSGVWMSNPMGVLKHLTRSKAPFKAAHLLMNIAGALPCTIPSMLDYKNPETKGYFDKYFVGKAGIPAEYRIRCAKLIADITSSPFAIDQMWESVLGGGTDENANMVMRRFGNFEERKKLAKKVAGIPE